MTPTGQARRPYEIALTPEAQRQLSRLPEKIVTAVLEGLYGSVARDPWRMSKPLHDELTGLRVTRRGQYRLVFRIDEAKRLVVVRRVDTGATSTARGERAALVFYGRGVIGKGQKIDA